MRVEGPFMKSNVSQVSCGWKHTAAISGSFSLSKTSFFAIFIVQYIQLTSETFLQITMSLPGDGEVLTARSLLTDILLVDNWFVSSSFLLISSLKHFTDTQIPFHFIDSLCYYGIKDYIKWYMLNCRDMVVI